MSKKEKNKLANELRKNSNLEDTDKNAQLSNANAL
jgi:hypothetical protein